MAEKPGQGLDHLFRHLQQWQYGGTSVGSLQAAGHCLKVKEGKKKKLRKGKEREKQRLRRERGALTSQNI